MKGPVISFTSYEIQHYSFERKHTDEDKINPENEKNQEPFSVSVESATTDDLTHGLINVSVVYDTVDVSIDIKVAGYFDIQVAEEPEKISEYLVVNGTAIVFPYIRSMISMLSSLDSEKAIIIPTINTMDLLPNKQ